MRTETQTMIDTIKQSLHTINLRLDIESMDKKLQELNDRCDVPDLWQQPAQAQNLMRARAELASQLTGYKTLKTDLDETVAMIELGEVEEDQDFITEAESRLKVIFEQVAKMQLESLLSGEADSNNCFLEVHAGAGGTESQDWAAMLLRMYSRWAEKRGYKLEVMEENYGEEAGIKSTTIKIIGHNAYGWLKTENGVHRLVRISPFDSQARRHTSFTSISIYPEIDDDIEITLEDKDLRIDTYRASGAGGQHVNRTDSAVRITHLPTGIVAQCQNDRSQHKNRASAMKMLRAKLYEQALAEREEEAQGHYQAKTDIGWGHQIRSYVLQPYQMVKDLRTGVEKGNAQAVLDGDLDTYLEAALAHRLEGAAGLTTES